MDALAEALDRYHAEAVALGIARTLADAILAEESSRVPAADATSAGTFEAAVARLKALTATRPPQP